MNSREQILGRVKAALAPLKNRAALPDVPAALLAPAGGSGAVAPTSNARTGAGSGDPTLARGASRSQTRWDEFAENLRGVHGTPFGSPTEMFAFLRSGGHNVGYCDPKLWPALQAFAPEGLTVHTTFDRTRVDDYSFGITAADGAIASTGTLILSDNGTSSRLGALAPWVHMAAVPAATIYADLSEAVAALPKDPNVIWVTGPSKTADVEGILIQGVHGPGVQGAFVW